MSDWREPALKGIDAEIAAHEARIRDLLDIRAKLAAGIVASRDGFVVATGGTVSTAGVTLPTGSLVGLGGALRPPPPPPGGNAPRRGRP